jgi:signal transduction histidine kinase
MSSRRKGRLAISIHATVSGIIAAATTLIWAGTGGYFWPKWVWLGLGIPMALHGALHGARQVKRPRARAIAIHGSISGVASGTLILIWAFAGGGTFWPIYPIAALGGALGLHAALAGILPTRQQQLVERVDELTRTRHGALNVQTDELRRIERDLHDGAQARLVAMGMSLGAIEHLLERDPEKARRLLAEARESSSKALTELRDLVRGIHPPVLAERGLGEAVRALAMASPLTTEVSVDLPGRVQAPVESAAYFAVSEVLTNAAKHSGARRVWIDLRTEDGMLRVVITDDGHGGADPSRGTGLRGIERRLGTFDGVLAVNSPAGGPTIVTMELQCELSAPQR